ncbi:unnamed protein product [Hymenolepis diminuta]|uniref:Uncharacterized protein n=1 Tax=Hymenolepis diminuta TaxID=6216 RepID=A0A564ZCA0_HYMDI|nr:unnamed protein product [Hymenolepis diminuta]
MRNRNLNIGGFLKVATSSVCSARKELLNENSADESTASRKGTQEHCQRSAHSLIHSLIHSLTHSENLSL